MASKIQSHNFYVAITPYKVQGVEEQYNELCVTAGYTQYQYKFYVSLHAGWKTTSGHGSMIMGDSNPLTASTWVYVKESPKNSQKTINEMGGALELAKADIAWLFNERMWPELRQFVKDVALYGYNAMLENRMQEYRRYGRIAVTPANAESETNNENNNQNSTTMTTTFKAADLIGKVIIVGNNQGTITVKSVQDNGMLACEFSKAGEDATTPMTVTMPNLQKMQERGLWKISDANEPSAVSPQSSDIKTEADVQEVQDIVPVVTKKPTPKAEEPKEEKPAAIVKPMETKPKAEPKPKAKTQPSCVPLVASEQSSSAAIKHQTSKYVYATYQTKKGKTGAKITGFASEDDVFYAMAAEIHASGSYERDKDGNKHYYLCFGPRYAEAAKSICKVLNSDKTVNQKMEECRLIVSQATEERATKREEWKQKREERKAQTSAVSPQISTEKTYTQTELAEWLRKLNSGTDKEKAAAAKFFNDLAKAA